jgi:hypothetical protein
MYLLSINKIIITFSAASNLSRISSDEASANDLELTNKARTARWCALNPLPLTKDLESNGKLVTFRGIIRKKYMLKKIYIGVGLYCVVMLLLSIQQVTITFDYWSIRFFEHSKQIYKSVVLVTCHS